jgi:dTMP kinase
MHKYITLEGIDGCGKSTLAKDISQELNLKHLYEPSNGEIGQIIRKKLFSKENLENLALLYIADRIENTKNIKENTIVERCFLSTMVYNSDNIDMSGILDLHKKLKVRIPDVIIYLELDPKVSMQRIDKKNKDIFENEEFLTKAIGKYEDAIKLTLSYFPDIKIIRINANDDYLNVRNKVITKILNNLR